ncbi:hypothetical protein ACGRHY_29240 [Streptomyces sp. HK10]|uniref:hypothetical protein n=1 Tax=Streptomyces sp. HK10 TaxID=3373255 RepID=UPI0037488F5F
MLNPAAPDELAAVAAEVGLGEPASPDLVAEVARFHAGMIRGGGADAALGRYCRGVLAPVLRRLVAAESDLAALRWAVARHIAAADQGEDPAPREVLDAAARAGIDLRADIETAAAVLEAESYAAAFG